MKRWPFRDWTGFEMLMVYLVLQTITIRMEDPAALVVLLVVVWVMLLDLMGRVL